MLKGDGPADVGDLSVELAARMLVLARAADDLADGERRIREAIASGAGLERFRRIIEQQGGDPHVVDDYGRLPTAPERQLVEAPRDGFLTSLDAELIGRASVGLGAGRDRVGQPVDAAVGIMVLRKPGDELRAGDPVLDLYYRDRIATRRRDGAGASGHPDRRPTTGGAAAHCWATSADGGPDRRAVDRSGTAVRHEPPGGSSAGRSRSPSSPVSPPGWA